MLGPQELQLETAVILRHTWILRMQPGPLEEPMILTAEPRLQTLTVTFQLLDIRK